MKNNGLHAYTLQATEYRSYFDEYQEKMKKKILQATNRNHFTTESLFISNTPEPKVPWSPWNRHDQLILVRQHFYMTSPLQVMIYTTNLRRALIA